MSKSKSLKHESEEVKKVRAYYESMIALMPGHVYWKDKNGVYLGCNELQAKTANLGSVKEIIGKTDYDLYPESFAKKLRTVDIEVMKTGKERTLEEKNVDLDGLEAVYLSKKVPLKNSEGEVVGLLGISMDITQRKRNEEKLQAEKEKVELTLEHIVANMPDHVFWKDCDGRFLGCNKIQANTLGFSSPREVIGKTAYETTTKDQADAIVKTDDEIMRSGKAITKEEPLVLDNGKKFIFLSKKVPLRDRQDNIVGILGISFDITAEKEAEQLRLEKKAIEERLGAMRLVSASMAHELRTPLRAISAGIMGIQQCLPSLIEAYKRAKAAELSRPEINPMDFNSLGSVFSSIQTETRAAFNIVDMLLVKADLSRITTTEFEICSIKHCLEESIERYSFNANEKDLIHWQQADFEFNGDELLMVHVFFNLFKNAFYYLKAAGKGDIQIWCEQDSKFNYLYFKDTGTGINKQDLAKVFDRFFSKTKHGTGIGLAFCKLVMESVGGDIVCRSTEGEFTEFKLSFPKLRTHFTARGQ